MILLVLLLVALVAVAGAGLLGVGVLSDDRRRPRSGLLALLSAPVVLGAGVILLAVLVLGVGGQGSEHDTPPAATPTTSSPAPAATLERGPPDARLGRATADVPVAAIQAAGDDRFTEYRPLTGLTPGSVVRVQAEGFGRFERGHAGQCVVELARHTACAESFPVQFDEHGTADFQFAVRDDVAPGRCRVGQPTCLLRVVGRDSGRRGSVQTVMVDRLGPGHVRVEPARGLADGQTVDVSVTGFPPGATATVVLCAPPDAYDARRCSSPGHASTFTIDGGGSGHASLVVAFGRPGVDEAACGPLRACGVVVVVGSGFVAAPAAPVTFSSGPGVAYDGGRVLTGVAIAAALVALAVAIALRTDWTRPAEAATPEMDIADLQTDRDLDEVFGTDEELDERDPIPW